MPPKRGARGGGRAASRTPGPQESPSTRLSTAYGSPAAPNAGPRALNSGGGASSALNRVLDDVDSANSNNANITDRVVRARTLSIFNPLPGRAQGSTNMPPGPGPDFPGAGAAAAAAAGAGPGPRGARTAAVQTSNQIERNARDARPPRNGDSENDETDSDNPDEDDDRSRMPPPPKRNRGPNNRKFLMIEFAKSTFQRVRSSVQ